MQTSSSPSIKFKFIVWIMKGDKKYFYGLMFSIAQILMLLLVHLEDNLHVTIPLRQISAYLYVAVASHILTYSDCERWIKLAQNQWFFKKL